MHAYFSSPEHKVLMVSYWGGWLFVVRRRVSCVVNVLSVDTLENPIVMIVLSRQYVGKVLIWLLTGQNLGHPGVILDLPWLLSRGHICDQF